MDNTVLLHCGAVKQVQYCCRYPYDTKGRITRVGQKTHYTPDNRQLRPWDTTNNTFIAHTVLLTQVNNRLPLSIPTQIDGTFSLFNNQSLKPLTIYTFSFLVTFLPSLLSVPIFTPDGQPLGLSCDPLSANNHRCE